MMGKVDKTLIIVMGVSGSGKSSVAKAVAQKFHSKYLDADDFHSLEAKQHMASGQALNNEMRKPWITALKLALEDQFEAGNSCALAFSGLQRQHRDQLRRVPYDTLFIHLEGKRTTIAHRINNRVNHFMSSELLNSQFDALEHVDNESDVVAINVDQPLKSVIEHATHAIENRWNKPIALG